MKNLITITLITFTLASCGIFKYKGEKPKNLSTWYIYQIDKENDSMYVYFAHEIDPSYIQVNNTWFVAPAKSYKLFDTICFSVYKPFKIKKE